MIPILDPRRHNRSVASGRFWMLTIRALLRNARESDWFTSLDLKDAYFHLPILKAHMGVAYEYQCLPFGYALAPLTYSLCMEAALEPLRCQRKTII